MPEHGLIIGKFDPPHRGHRHLIEMALGQVDRLTVIVCRRDADFVDGTLRAQWIREMYPMADVMLIDDQYPGDDSAVWADNAIRWLGHAPDVVFTSEEYGDPWAAHLGCRHVLVDRERIAVAISATMIRSDPRRYWEYLDPCVRAHFALRVVVVGAESTGTTTLAKALAGHYRTTWVTEYGREYSEAKLANGFDVVWETDEFIHIAREQARREDQAAREANRLLVCDTDPLATGIWHERYVGHRSPDVEAVSMGRRVDLHILTGPGIPFVQDGLRDGEAQRDWMHGRFRDMLRDRGGAWIEVSGSRDERVSAAVAAVNSLLDDSPPMALTSSGAVG